VGSAIVKFFSGDFSGALDDVKGAVSGIGDEIASEFNQAMKLKAELQAITDATRELNKERARQNKEIAAAKLVINDETKSIAERQAALEKVRQAEIALAKQEEVLAQRRYDAIKAQNALSDSSKEALDEEAAAYIALQAAQQASLQKQKELFDQQKALRDKERAERQARAAEYKANLKALNDFEQNLMLESIQNEQEKARKQLEIERQSQLDQIKELKITAAKKAELTLMVEANTQLKRQKLEEESYAKSLEAVLAFRAQLIAQELLYDDSIAKMIDNRAQKEVDMAMKVVEGEYEGYIDREKYLKDFETTQANLLDDASKAYQRYYDTQRFAAEEQFKYDMSLGDERREERDKQLAEVRKQQEIEFKMLVKAEEEKTGQSYMTHERLKEIRLEAAESTAKREAEINEYFDNYEKTRTAAFNAEMENIDTAHQERITATLQKFSAVRQKINEQEAQAEQMRVQLAIDGFNAVAELAGRESVLGKSLAVISVGIQSVQAAQAAYLSQLSVPTPDALVRAQIAYGIALAQGAASIMSIMKVNTDVKAADGMVVGQGSGKSDNVPVMVSNGETIVNARSSKMFKGLLSSINQAGGGRRFAAGGISSLTTQTSPEQNMLNQLVGQGGQPVKTYVVSTEMSSMQSLDRQIKSRSVL